MRLVIQIQAVADQLVELDLRRPLETSTLAAPTAFPAALSAISPLTALASGTRSALWAAPALARRAVACIALLLLFCHVLDLSHQSGPLQGHQPPWPQLHFRRFLSYQLVDQVRAQFLKLAVARTAQDAIETALEAPGALHVRAFAIGLAPVEAAQLMQELFGHPEFMDQPRDHILELGRIRQVLP